MLHKVLKKFIIDYNDNVSKNGVYMIFHIDKPNIFYIGSSKREYKKKKCKNGCYGRWIEHYNKLMKGNHHSIYLQNTINKHGVDGIRFKLIALCEYDVREIESYYINQYDSFNNGYNCTDVTTVPVLTKELREVSRKRMIDKNPMYNKDNVRKMLETRKKSYPPSKIYQYSKEGVFIKEWYSIEDASLNLGVDGSNINRVITGETKSSAGYIWFYKDKFSKENLDCKLFSLNTKYRQSAKTIKKRAESQKKKVAQLDKDNNILKIFNSAKDAGKEVGRHPSNITRCCKGKTKYSRGFKWKYAE